MNGFWSESLLSRLYRPFRKNWSAERDVPGPTEQALSLLQQCLNDASAQYREDQWAAIYLLVHERARLFVVQRTGWGKSLVYFMATRLQREAGSGPTLLISPLLALMRNQMLAAERLGLRARTINSSNADEWDTVVADLTSDQVDILLVSPERLARRDFQGEVLGSIVSRIGLLVVDEAHCLSDWGHDFRPDYRRVEHLVRELPDHVPVLATTATVNDRVVADVREALGAERLQVLRGCLARESLCLQTIVLPAQPQRYAWISEHVPDLPGSGIVYTLTVHDAQGLAAWLQHEGIAAHAYWGGLDDDERRRLEMDLLANRMEVLVSTPALGMGFDKPDLGWVIHFQRPGSVVHYYQQVGRAGRAVDTAYGILLHGREDDDIVQSFARTAVQRVEDIRTVLAALPNSGSGCTLPELQRSVNLGRSEIERILEILDAASPSPVLNQDGRWCVSGVPYIPDLQRIEALTVARKREQERMSEYIAGETCLMQFLQREMDDRSGRRCGRCEVCVGRPLIDPTYDRGVAQRAHVYLQNQGSTH